jgi:hypothetical protein
MTTTGPRLAQTGPRVWTWYQYTCSVKVGTLHNHRSFTTQGLGVSGDLTHELGLRDKRLSRNRLLCFYEYSPPSKRVHTLKRIQVKGAVGVSRVVERGSEANELVCVE